jgi:hypothetical protein
MMNAFLHVERDEIDLEKYSELGSECELGCGFYYIVELGGVGWARQMVFCSSFGT